MYKILIAGCGNIGALYDWDNDKVLTHAKAFAMQGNFKVSFFDKDYSLSEKVAKRYHAELTNDLEEATLNQFDCLSICTPTDTHFDILKNAFAANVKVIVCEKPVSRDKQQLQDLAEYYKKASSKVVVNYIRRFLPAYEKLREAVSGISINEKLTNIAIRYQRGFVNNCSHAFDLIEYLTFSEISLHKIQASNSVLDHFADDPTLSLQANWNGINVNILGLSNVLFSHFEIDLYFQYHKIEIRNAGADIDIYRAEKNETFLNPLSTTALLTENNCLDNYMIPVANHVNRLLSGENKEDNFIRSVNMNLRMLQYIKYTDGQTSN